MSDYATKGATLKCTGGSAPSKLQVTSNSLLSVQGNEVATISDKVPNTNIMPFGACKMKPFSPPCVPAPIMWTGFLTSVEVPGGNPLLKISTIQCACGGMIQFQDSGQFLADKVQISPDSPQIRALKKAAHDSTPFCEECEKLKEEKKQIRAVDVYWIEDGDDERHYELFPDYEVTLYIETMDYTPGETLSLEYYPPNGRLFKDKQEKNVISGIVDDEGIVSVNNFKPEYEDYE